MSRAADVANAVEIADRLLAKFQCRFRAPNLEAVGWAMFAAAALIAEKLEEQPHFNAGPG